MRNKRKVDEMLSIRKRDKLAHAMGAGDEVSDGIKNRTQDR
jgi:hypothetical protein